MTKTNPSGQCRIKLRPKRKLKLENIIHKSLTECRFMFDDETTQKVPRSSSTEQNPPACPPNHNIKPNSDFKPIEYSPQTVSKTSQPLSSTFKLNPILTIESNTTSSPSSEPKLNLLPMFGIPVELEFSLPTSLFGVAIEPDVVARANRRVIDHINTLNLKEVIKDEQVKNITFEPIPNHWLICCIYKPELAYKTVCLSAHLVHSLHLMLKTNPTYKVIVHTCQRPKKISMGIPQNYDPTHTLDITKKFLDETNFLEPLNIVFFGIPPDCPVDTIDEIVEQMEQAERMRPPELQMCAGIYLYDEEINDPRNVLGWNENALLNETEDKLESCTTSQSSADDEDSPYIDDSQVENIKFVPLPLLKQIYCISKPGLVFKEKVFDPDELELFKYILESNTRFRVIVRMCQRPKRSQMELYQKDLVDVDTVLQEYDFTDKMINRLQKKQTNSKFVFWSHSKGEEQLKPYGEHLCYGVYLYEKEKCCCITCLTKELSIKPYTINEGLMPKNKPMKYNIAVPIGNVDKDPVSAFLASVATITTTQRIDLT